MISTATDQENALTSWLSNHKIDDLPLQDLYILAKFALDHPVWEKSNENLFDRIFQKVEKTIWEENVSFDLVRRINDLFQQSIPLSPNKEPIHTPRTNLVELAILKGISLFRKEIELQDLLDNEILDFLQTTNRDAIYTFNAEQIRQLMLILRRMDISDSCLKQIDLMNIDVQTLLLLAQEMRSNVLFDCCITRIKKETGWKICVGNLHAIITIDSFESISKDDYNKYIPLFSLCTLSIHLIPPSTVCIEDMLEFAQTYGNHIISLNLQNWNCPDPQKLGKLLGDCQKLHYLYLSIIYGKIPRLPLSLRKLTLHFADNKISNHILDFQSFIHLRSIEFSGSYTQGYLVKCMCALLAHSNSEHPLVRCFPIENNFKAKFLHLFSERIQFQADLLSFFSNYYTVNIFQFTIQLLSLTPIDYTSTVLNLAKAICSTTNPYLRSEELESLITSLEDNRELCKRFDQHQQNWRDTFHSETKIMFLKKHLSLLASGIPVSLSLTPEIIENAIAHHGYVIIPAVINYLKTKQGQEFILENRNKISFGGNLFKQIKELYPWSVFENGKFYSPKITDSLNEIEILYHRYHLEIETETLLSLLETCKFSPCSHQRFTIFVRDLTYSDKEKQIGIEESKHYFFEKMFAHIASKNLLEDEIFFYAANHAITLHPIGKVVNFLLTHYVTDILELRSRLSEEYLDTDILYYFSQYYQPDIFDFSIRLLCHTPKSCKKRIFALVKKSERTKESIINTIENDEIACKQLEKYYEKQALLTARDFEYSWEWESNYFLSYIRGVESGLPFLKHPTSAAVKYIFSNEKKRLSPFIEILLNSERGQRFVKNNEDEMNSEWPILLDVAKLICPKEQV